MTWLFAAILFIAATPPTDAEHSRLNAMVVISSCSSSSWPHAQAELARAEMQSEIVGHLNKAAADLEPAGWRLKTLEVLVELTRSAQNNTILHSREPCGTCRRPQRLARHEGRALTKAGFLASRFPRATSILRRLPLRAPRTGPLSSPSPTNQRVGAEG